MFCLLKAVREFMRRVDEKEEYFHSDLDSVEGNMTETEVECNESASTIAISMISFDCNLSLDLRHKIIFWL